MSMSDAAKMVVFVCLVLAVCGLVASAALHNEDAIYTAITGNTPQPTATNTPFQPLPPTMTPEPQEPAAATATPMPDGVQGIVNVFATETKVSVLSTAAAAPIWNP